MLNPVLNSAKGAEPVLQMGKPGSGRHGNVLLKRKDSWIWEFLGTVSQDAWCYILGVSDTRMGVNVLSTAQALEFLLRVTPHSCWLTPLAKHPSFPKRRTAPPCLLRLARGQGLEGASRLEGRRGGARRAAPPAPCPRYSCFSKPAPRAAFLPSPLSRSLRALSPLSGSFTAQSVIN